MATDRIKKMFTAIPDTLVSAGVFIVSIADTQREMNRLKRDAKDKIDVINRELAKNLAPLRSSRDAHFNNFFAFAGPKKVEFTKRARSVTLPEGTFGWRWTPPYVVARNDLTDAELISNLKNAGCTRYIRVIEEVDRALLLKDRPELSFLAYEQREEFFVKPKLVKGDGTAEELTTEVVDC